MCLQFPVALRIREKGALRLSSKSEMLRLGRGQMPLELIDGGASVRGKGVLRRSWAPGVWLLLMSSETQK